jgi:molybdopterin/thiamine biosynthesis adenylyltransferase
VVIDSYDRQLRELAAVRLPSAGEYERHLWIEEFAKDHPGVWVYLSWERKLARILDREEYFEVVTNRNRDKITLEEQRLLRGKRVGVMGLSVGGEAAVTLAQEHLCGHIVLADFDLLDLSNLNRLQGGFDDLGVNKAVLVARRVARIDPYLEVTIFPDGVTEENAEEFLRGLDLLVEECDHLPMKHGIRERARRVGLNVVFAGDERGFLSVEPYREQPELRPFHGRIERRQPPREAFPDRLSFLKALTEWLGGWDAISDRSRQSLEGVGDTLVGYPQLASEARFAAGQVGHVARRLLLGEKLAPFVGHLDLEELLSDAGSPARDASRTPRNRRRVKATSPPGSRSRSRDPRRPSPMRRDSTRDCRVDKRM